MTTLAFDAKEKVILCIVGDPPSDDPKFLRGQSSHLLRSLDLQVRRSCTSRSYRRSHHHRTDLASYGWDVVEHSKPGRRTYLAEDANPKLQAASWIQLDIAKKGSLKPPALPLKPSSRRQAKERLQGAELLSGYRRTSESTIRPFESPNVIGILPGAIRRTTRPSSIPLTTITSGLKPGMAGDNIYNGAVDNSTGVGVILELAHAGELLCQEGHLKLPHSVILSSVLQRAGASWPDILGQHPPIPAGQIAR